jgi:hypothetical protein
VQSQINPTNSLGYILALWGEERQWFVFCRLLKIGQSPCVVAHLRLRACYHFCRFWRRWTNFGSVWGDNPGGANEDNMATGNPYPKSSKPHRFDSE